MVKFRTLKAEEIDVRVQSFTKNENGAYFLLYIDARVCENILDNTVGCMNWQRMHSRDNANCIVSIWCDEKKMWVSKEDTGSKSNTEADKGLASDSFKRACVNWGIGRELFTAPQIYIPVEFFNVKEKNGKPCTFDIFTVNHIEIDETDGKREIVALGISRNGTRIYSWKKGEKAQYWNRIKSTNNDAPAAASSSTPSTPAPTAPSAPSGNWGKRGAA